MRKIKRVVILSLMLSLLAGTCFAQGSYGMPYDDAETYIQALEDAMDARYGGRDGWPQGFDTFLAVARYYGGLDTSYEAESTWLSKDLQAMEAKFDSDINNRIIADTFLYGLTSAIEYRDGFARTWPYEALALMGAALMYAGTVPLSSSWALPAENALASEEAMAIARDAVQEKYGLSDEDITELGVYSYYTVDMRFDSPYWCVTIGVKNDGGEVYYAFIASPSGEVLLANRNDGNG